MSSSVNIGEITVDITRKEIKNLRLSVCPPDGSVRVAAPLSVQDETIRLYLISKLGWIKREQRKFKEQQRQGAREYIAKESHYFLGKRYLLKVTPSEKQTKILLSKRYIHLHVKQGSQEQRKKAINEWYRAELKNIATPLISKWEKALGVKVEAFGVKQMKTKWGSCNKADGRIWLNLELAKKHPSAIEYVVLHEMVHLVERLHNDRFFAILDKHMPRWREYKRELGLTL